MKQLRDTLSANNFYGRTLTQRLTEDYARIIANPHIRGVRIVPSTAIDISTDVIEMMHDGVRYKIGTFVIRFLLDGEVVIWTDESYHPNSIPHPHISPWTGPCFGNVGTTIEDAVVEFRFADALEYILEWLTNGYAPELVIYNKLEEWPVVGANERSEHATQ